MLKLAVVVLLCFAASSKARALDPVKNFSQYALSSWTHANGLAPNSVMSIAQTSDGFLWLATEQGLVRWDGVSMTTFDEQNAPELGDRFIRSLSADPDGSLWIGTMSGIAHYSAGHFQSYRQRTRNFNDVYDLCADGQGGVWFSSDWGLHHYGTEGNHVYTVADGLPSNGVTGLSRAGDGSLWIGTTKGLANLREGSFAVYMDWAPLRRSAINAIGVGAHGVMWVGLADGTLGRWTGSAAGGQIETWWVGAKTRGRPIECLREDRDGTVWIAFKQAGLARLRGHQLELMGKRDALPSTDPDWIFEDREQSLWVGWADAGLSMLRDTKFTTFGKAEGLSSDHVLSLTGAADGGLWIGTSDAGVNYLHGGKVTPLTTRDGLATNGVLGLLEQRDGTLLVGSDSGVVTALRGSTTTSARVTRTLEPGIPAMVEDSAGQVWLAADMPDGLVRWTGKHFEQQSLPGRAVALAATRDGTLWIAAYHTGLIRLKDGISRIFDQKDGLPSLALTSLYADQQGAVWIGTELSGLVRVKDGKITSFTSRQGLFDDAVGSIAEDDRGFLWMGGSRGIWRVPKQELTDYAAGRLTAVHSEAYGYADGLRSLQTSFTARPAVWKTKDGRLWFATTGGVSMIDPAHILMNAAPPLVSIVSVQYHDGSADSQAKSTPRLTGSGTIDVNFVAPSFVAPELMQIRYRLGASEWINAGQRRSASFSHLRPGEYTFEVQAANSHGIWNVRPAVLHFSVVSHFYQTDWFRLLAVLASGSALWCLYVTRVHFFKGRAQRLEEIVSRRTAELRIALESAESARELLREQATKDSLTGLWNRRALFEILEAELVRCRADRRPFCVVMVDADCFKALNDTYGHLAGDRVIQEISQRLRRGLRVREAIGRYGGEELVVLLPDCSFRAAILRVEELRISIEASPILFESREMWVTCSFGVSQAGLCISGTEILAQADEALYRAKRAGRNCVRPTFIEAERAGDIETDPAAALDMALAIHSKNERSGSSGLSTGTGLDPSPVRTGLFGLPSSNASALQIPPRNGQ